MSGGSEGILRVSIGCLGKLCLKVKSGLVRSEQDRTGQVGTWQVMKAQV